MRTGALPFSFGRNWARYVDRHFNEDRLHAAQAHLLDFLGVADLRGRRFLDVGCGSGLHSLAALRAGAARIVSFDVDPDCVAAASRLRALSGDPAHWRIVQGSILDRTFLTSLEPADVVYAWGVLHHTGAMWQAMDNTVALLAPGGSLYIALYDYEIQRTPEYWLDVKRRYNQAGALHRRLMEVSYIWQHMLGRHPRNLPALLRRMQGRRRGMAFYTDLVDWLGGWPMEFARRPDVQAWAGRSALDMLTMKTGRANTEYLFRHASADAGRPRHTHSP